MGASVSTGLARVGALAACGAVLAGCGNDGSQSSSRVRLRVSSPSDGTQVHASSVTITGSVTPAAATVLVLGRAIPVNHGSFTTQVPLAPGMNIVDVLAGGPRAQPALTAVRVFRQVLVEIPSLTGDSTSDAQLRLRTLGLVPRINKNESFFSILLPESDAVCGTTPGAGSKVAPGTAVTVTVSKTC